jgi:hypothetical protein
MKRIILAAAAVAAILAFAQRPVLADVISTSPWCAVISFGAGSVYWDCQYHSFEDCYRRGNILAGNRGFCNPSPYYVANATEHRRSVKRRARPQ